MMKRRPLADRVVTALVWSGLPLAATTLYTEHLWLTAMIADPAALAFGAHPGMVAVQQAMLLWAGIALVTLVFLAGRRAYRFLDPARSSLPVTLSPHWAPTPGTVVDLTD